MDFKQKYYKYKQKYLNLQNKYSIKSNFILDDNSNIFQGTIPDSIRILKDIDKNKIVILLGERHDNVELYNNTRIDPKKGYDKFIGHIFKNMNLAIKNKDGLHNNDPFKKVLFLTETNPTAIFLGGGKKELAPDLFVDKIVRNSLEYVRGHLEKNKDKYKDNMLIIDADIRKNLQIDDVMPTTLQQKIERNLIMPSQIQHIIDFAIFNIKHYIFENNNIRYSDLPFEDIKSEEIAKIYKFFTGNDTVKNIQNRQAYDRSKNLQNIFIKTGVEFAYFKNLLKEEIDILEKHPKIFTNEKYNHLNLIEKLKIYEDLCPRMNTLVARITDFLILEYIEEMQDCSTTVVIAGEAHTNFLFKHLCLIDNYELIETEKTIFVKVPNTNYYKPDLHIFPYDNTSEINEFNLLIKMIRDEIKNFNSLNDINKKYFYNNLLTLDSYYYITKNTENNENIELSLIDSFGLFFKLLKDNRTSLYSQNITYSHYLPI